MFFKKKFDKLKREDIVAAILQLQEQEQAIEEGLAVKLSEINKLLEKGRKETDRTTKLFYAKKINSIKTERENSVQRAMYLMYNMQLLGKLKEAIDDKNFIADVGGLSLNKLLADQKGLAQFLNKALNNKIRSEDIMTGADEVFAEVRSSYEPSQAIYGVNQNDDDMLAMFEIEEAMSADDDIAKLDDDIKSKEKARSQ